MSEQQVRVMFQPHGRAVYVLHGTKILEAAARAGLVNAHKPNPLSVICLGMEGAFSRPGSLGFSRLPANESNVEPSSVPLKTIRDTALILRRNCRSLVSLKCLLYKPQTFLSRHLRQMEMFSCRGFPSEIPGS